jgi:hypothetical protein
MLEITEDVVEDTSIVSFETFEFLPVSGTNLNSAGQVRIRVENSDNFYYPAGSWLSFTGHIANGANRYDKAKKITMVNNALMYLWDCIKYELNGTEIESLYHPGYATTIAGLVKYPESYNSGPGLNSGWTLDTGAGTIADKNKGWNKRHAWFFSSTPVGDFRICIRLDHIFGFALDYNRVLYGLTHTLTLVRNSTSNDALYRSAVAADAVTDGTISFDQIAWCLPRVTPSDVAKFNFLKLIEDKITVPISFRQHQCLRATVEENNYFTYRLGVRSSTERPRWIIVGFQTDRSNDQTKNNSLFDHCNLTNAYVLVNNSRYPMIDLNLDFTKNRFENMYVYYLNFMKQYFDIDPIVNSPAVDPVSFKTLHPLYVFNLSYQSERMKDSVLDITFKAFFSANVPKDTVAYILMLSERQLRFRSDGNKLNVIV